VGLAVGGEAGSRLLSLLAMPISGDALINDIRRQPEPKVPTPRVLGIDDWAQLKGRRYGTILVDLETHRPIDLLETSGAAAIAGWLHEHPGVEIISRDRSKEYARGVSDGAPNAIQVADRWHLLKNLREALQKMLEQKRHCLKAAARAEAMHTLHVNKTIPPAAEASAIPTQTKGAGKAPTQAQLDKSLRRARREARFQHVRYLHQDGRSNRSIARELRMSTRTVQKYLLAEECPQYTRATESYPSKLRCFLPYLEAQWQAGRTNACQLFREIRAQGYEGSRGLVANWAARQRMLLPHAARYSRKQPADVQPKLIKHQRPAPWSAARASWLLVKDGDKLDEEERLALERMMAADAAVRTAADLAQRFVRLVKERQQPALLPWLEEVTASGIRALSGFVGGIRADLAAVLNALALPWSNGQTEGQINRLKFIKRQMYGRAKHDLLRKRILHLATW
jgi:transposase